MKQKKLNKNSVLVIPKLSTVKMDPRFCKCQRCRLVFENDVNTSHAPCPKCKAVMENISWPAADNLRVEWDKEAAAK